MMSLESPILGGHVSGSKGIQSVLMVKGEDMKVNLEFSHIIGHFVP